ncbi:GtrA family protein [Kitasatospora sp. NPDC089913]|uniref:GtrA family protein n=1 Tax=Streptomycetaceae TaxID=2062 RepID=UPI00087BCC51|nr:GtrA family protein [Streptomyces sp. TLI_053]SDT75161.1 Putative flippase GtrA (transmembrane translocase of bactoprenol-linked glucose) [Streptomyces sp. TLI_053]
MATTTVSDLAQKLRGIKGEVVKFGIVGLSGVIVNAGVFWVCLKATGPINSLSGWIATSVAIGTNYLGYRYWLYRDRDTASRKREITLFLIFSGIGMLIENGINGFSVHVLGYDSATSQLIAKNVIGLTAGTVFRFFSYRTWVFKALPELPAEPAAEQPTVQDAPAAAVVAQAELVLAAERTRLAKAE